MEQKYLFPVTDSEDFVSLSSLPGDANEVLELLRMELVPLSLWRATAMEYLRSGDVENCEIILRAGCDREVQSVPVYAKETSDQVALFNSLAASLSHQAAFSGHPSLLIEARELHERASLLEMLNQYTWVGKGNTLLCSYIADKTGSASSAFPSSNNHHHQQDFLLQSIKQFQLAIDDPTGTCSLIAHLGKAHALLLQQNFKQALEEYRYVVRNSGNPPNNARIGIGMCQFRLGRHAKAVEAFRRALSVDPNSVEALVGLADLNAAVAAFEIDSANPGVLAQVAFHVLLGGTGDALNAELLARKSVAQAVSPELKSFANLVLGASLHAQRRFDEAHKMYTTAVAELGNQSKSPIIAAAKIGSAQCCLALGLDAEANGLITLDGKPKYPDNTECLRLWAYLNARQIRKDLSRKYHPGKPPMSGIGGKLAALDATIEKVMKESSSEGVEIMTALKAMVALDICDTDSASRENLKLLDRLTPSEETILSKIALLISLGDLESASAAVQAVDKSDASANDVFEYSSALVQELQGNVETAELAYAAVMDRSKEERPLVWAMCMIRLAMIAEKTGKDVKYEIPLAEDGKPVMSESVDLLLLAKAQFQARTDDVNGAIRTLASVGSLKHDHYANVLLGDLWFSKAVSCGSKGDLKEEEKCLDGALKYYSRSLEVSSCAFQAVSGTACVLAHKNRKWQASDLFKSLADVRGNLPVQDAAVQINLGHLLMDGEAGTSAMDNAKKATKFYEAAARALSSHADGGELNRAVKQYLASAYFATERFEESLSVLSEISDPWEAATEYNSAVVMENFGARILMDKQKAQSIDWIQRAVDLLKSAMEKFEHLTQFISAPDNVRSIPRGLGIRMREEKGGLAEHLNYCKTTVPQAENWLAARSQQLQEEALRREQLEEARKVRADLERQRLLEIQAREEEEAEIRARQVEQRIQDLKDSLSAAMKSIDEPKRAATEADGGPDAPEEDGDFKKKRRGRPTKNTKRLKKGDEKKNVSSSSSSSSSSSDSDDDSSSDSSSDSSDSSSSSSAGSAQAAKKDALMDELFGEEAL